MIGTEAERFCTVDKTNIASTVACGAIDVFSTPMMIALMEGAALDCIAPFLEEGMSSVGGSVNISHVSATPVGMKIRAVAKVTAVDGKKVTFSVKAYDEVGLIGEGEHVRFIINVERFTAKAAAKLSSAERRG